MHEANRESFSFPSPGQHRPPEVDDVLTEIARQGARRMLAMALDVEAEQWIADHAHLTDERGRRQVVRNGRSPARHVSTGIGPLEVAQPRVHDRRPEGEREKFTSKILPPYLRKTKSIEELIPWLYLKGISTGDFQEALQSLLGPDCPGLSATTVTRLKETWEAEYREWSRRELSEEQYAAC